MKHPPRKSLRTQLFLSSKYLISFGAVALLLTGCQTTSNNNIPTLSAAEADSYRQQLIQEFKKKGSPVGRERAIVFVQPSNKTEACLIPEPQARMNRPGIRIFWDGGCKNGYVHGLGREIAIGDSGYHYDTVSVFSEEGNRDGPEVSVNYQEKYVVMSVRKGKINASKNRILDLDNTGTTIVFEPWINHTGYTTATMMVQQGLPGDNVSLTMSPTAPNKTFRREKDGVIYQVIDMTAQPQRVVNPLTHVVQILSSTGQTGGVGWDVYKNGVGVAYKLGGARPQQVNVPDSYFATIGEAIGDLNQALAEAMKAQASAAKMMTQYAGQVCDKSNISVPNGLSRQTYLEICTFPSKMQAEVEKSVQVAGKEFEQNKEKAAIELAANEKKYKEEQEHQARMNVYRAQANAAQAQVQAAQAQANAAAWASINASLANTSRMTSAMLQNTLSSPPQIYSPSIGSSTSIYYVRSVSPNVTTVRQLR